MSRDFTYQECPDPPRQVSRVIFDARRPDRFTALAAALAATFVDPFPALAASFAALAASFAALAASLTHYFLVRASSLVARFCTGHCFDFLSLGHGSLFLWVLCRLCNQHGNVFTRRCG